MKDITRVPRIAQKAYWNESFIPLGPQHGNTVPIERQGQNKNGDQLKKH